MSLQPLVDALGSGVEGLAPGLRDLFLRTEGAAQYRGIMTRVGPYPNWQGQALAPVLWLTTFVDLLFPETGRDIPFEMEIEVRPLPDGRLAMIWRREFHFPRRTRRFFDILTFEEERRVLVDWLGRGLFVAADLRARVHRGEVWIATGRTRLHLGRRTLLIPTLLGASALVRTQQRPDGRLAMTCVVRSPILGRFFGYEGTFWRADEE